MSKHAKLAPHLVVNGGLAAIKFYEDAFDADTQAVMMAEDGKRVMHSVLEINDGIIYVCDDFGGDDKPGAQRTAGASVMIHLQLKKPKHVDAIMQQAVDHGAKVVMPAEDAFWGDRYGQIRDPFGHVWTFGAELKKKDQMQAAMASSQPAAKAPAPKPTPRRAKN